MRLLLLLALVAIAILLSACAAPRGGSAESAHSAHTIQAAQAAQATPAPYAQQRTVSKQPVFVSLKTYGLQAPQDEEKSYLRQISSMLNQLLILTNKAQADSKATGRVIFDYNTMLLDLQAINFGVNQYFLTQLRSPRVAPSQINDYSVQGNYVRIGN